MEPTDYSCSLCGQQATKIYRNPEPNKYVFLCDLCLQEDEYLLDSLEPIVAYEEGVQQKVINRHHKQRSRYIEQYSPTLPQQCQKCGSTENIKSKMAEPLRTPWLVYRLCPSCIAKDDFGGLVAIDIREY